MIINFFNRTYAFLRERYLLAPIAIMLTPVLLFLFLNLLFPLPMDKLNRESSVAVYSENGELLNIFLTSDDKWRTWTDLDDIPKFVQNAIVKYEDKWFYYHPGVNPFALFRAMYTNIRERRTVSGASTLTMQVARMIEPKDRTAVSKLIEIFRASQLEMRFSKTRILEYYFNLAPYGGNIEGIGSASYFYFGKSPSVLSKSDALTLVGLPNSPSRLRPDRYPKAAMKHRNKVAGILLGKKSLTDSEYTEILKDPVPQSRTTPPNLAPHFTRFVREQNSSSSNITSTLNLEMQKICEHALEEQLSSLRYDGITNGAVVVIDNKTRKIKAMVGSADFFNNNHSGQVNGATAPRSPGSALKPFAYAIALDEGLISPKMMLSDVPIKYSDYSPSNYDSKFRGGVHADYALKHSLNVPAVNLHAQLKSKFLSFLKQGGITTLDKPWEYYGLPLVLGAGEVNLVELTNLYASFATSGFYEPYRVQKSDEKRKSERILSDATCFIMTDILSDITRPDLPNCWEFSINMPKVAWKTGTSYGHRDAWSVGYNPEFTIGVWIGNFDGREAERLVGAEAAAPLLFGIFNSIADGSKWFDQPDSVGTRMVCSVDGLLPSEYTPQTIEENYIKGVSPVQRSRMHQLIAVDKKTGLRLKRAYTLKRDYEEKILEIWPADIASWRQRNGYPVDAIPEYLSDDDIGAQNVKPIIVSPQGDSPFYLRDDAPVEHQKILLEASVSNTVNRIYWFIDGSLYAECIPGEKQFFFPTRGSHEISCVDDEGNSSKVKIQIM
jgi:penicillin-binding protein 1C